MTPRLCARRGRVPRRRRIIPPRAALLVTGAALVLSAFGAAACRSAPAASDAPHIREEAAFFPAALRENPPWRPLAPGLDFLEWRVPRSGVHNYALKIALTRPGIRVLASPPPGAVDAAGVFRAESPAAFARRTGAAVVINATPFDMPGGILSRARRLAGVYRAESADISQPRPRYAALGFFPDNRAFIQTRQTDAPDAAVLAGGFFTILRDGEVLRQKAASLDARMCAGISADGGALIVLAAAGNGRPFARGMTYEECAVVLAAFGAQDALQLDGGSSVWLVVEGRALIRGILPGNALGFAGFAGEQSRAED